MKPKAAVPLDFEKEEDSWVVEIVIE